MRSGKRRCCSIMALFFFITLLVPSAANAATEDLSIAQAIELARSSNPQITSLGLQVDRAQILRDDVADAVSFLPTGQLVVDPNGQAMVNNYEQSTIQLDTLKKQHESEQKRIEKEVVSAYSTALISANDLQATRLSLQEMEKQGKLVNLARSIGMVSNYDNNKYAMSIEQMQDTLSIQSKQYDTAIATLRSLLNKGNDWEPCLTSKAVLNKYSRQSLSIENIRAVTESINMLSATKTLEMEQIKVFWPGFDGQDRYLDQIDLHVKELDYEKTKRETWSTVEQLYYGIDALETQISLSSKVLTEKEKELQLMQLKYDMGLISLRSLQSGGESLETTRINVQKAKLDLETLHAKLASNKANYAYLTGQTVYSKLDWQ